MAKPLDLIAHILWRITEKPFSDQYPRVLASLLKDCDTVLDVGSGDGALLKRLDQKIGRTVGVDIFEPSLQIAKAKGIHDDYKVMDVMQLDSTFSPKSFDGVLCSDVIEHFSKEDGYKLIRMMTLIARKKLVVFTPNGFFPQEAKNGNPHQLHLSGWTTAEMKQHGFQKIIGIHGWKTLCRRYPQALSKPHFLWRGLSSLTQPFFLNVPRHAFQILCVKTISD